MNDSTKTNGELMAIISMIDENPKKITKELSIIRDKCKKILHDRNNKESLKQFKEKWDDKKFCLEMASNGILTLSEENYFKVFRFCVDGLFKFEFDQSAYTLYFLNTLDYISAKKYSETLK